VPTVCLYFQLHQPHRLRRYSIFDRDSRYFDDYRNGEICRKVAHKCYLPATQLVLDLIRRHEGRFRLAYSLTGSIIEQFERHAPEVLDLFRRLAETGCVEFLAETYYHSLSFLYSRDEFVEQVRKHVDCMERLFDVRPRVFRNTELIYNNDLAHFVERMGYKVILCEGVDQALGGRTPNVPYRCSDSSKAVLLLRNYRLTDDVAFRFSCRDWPEYPLTAAKYADWITRVNGSGTVINLFMDYETFGEHQWADTGIFEFLRSFPGEVLARRDNDFKTPSEVAASCPTGGVYDVPHMISWADTERDLSAWLGNAMQSNALHELYRLEREVKTAGDPKILHDWRLLQSSDHFYYMSTKHYGDGVVHRYFNPYESPYDSYINFMNVLDHLRLRIGSVLRERLQSLRTLETR